MSSMVRQPRTYCTSPLNMAMMKWSLLCLALVFIPGCVSNRQLSKLPDCNADGWFNQRRMYIYKYEASVMTGFLGASDIASGSKLTCTVKLIVYKKCETSMELSGCKLLERGEDGNFSQSQTSRFLAMDLHRSEVQLQINHGVVVDHQMVVDKKDPLYVVNIKRAIASQLQLPILPADKYDDIVVQHDIFGACPTRFTFSADEKNVITTTRDLTMCQMPQVQGSQLSLLSFVKNFQLNVLEGNTDEMIYPFRSEVNCTYKLSGNRRIESSECAQHETFQPFISDGPSQTHPVASVKQLLTLESVVSIPRNKRAMSRGLQGREIVDLSMTFEQTEEPETMAPQIFSQLNSLMNTYSALSQDLPPVNFRALVNLMRNAKESVLEEVLDSLILCRSSALLCPLKVNSGDMKPSLLQDISETFFADGLLSCGSDACVATYATCLQRGLVGDVAGGVTLFNMALFYAPSPAVVKKIFEFCKVKSTRTCWLSLGSLVNKLSNSVRNNNNRNYVNEGKKVLKEILQHLRAGMGDTCRLTNLDPATQHYTLASLLDTVKTLGNAGDAIQMFYDNESKDGKGLVPALIRCLKNSALPEKISRAVILAMGKLELNKELQKVFMDLLSDVMRPSSLRTVAFDYLLRLEDETSVRALLQAIQAEQMTSLKFYMVTRLIHLLESNLPHAFSLRSLWRKVMKEQSFQLPVIEELRGRGSHHGEFSFHTEVPVSKMPAGAKFVINVVYDPSRIVFSSVRVSLTITIGNFSHELVDIGLDVQGFENIAREFLGPEFKWRDVQPGALIAKIMQAVLSKTRKVPTFFFEDKTVVQALQELFQRVNMPSGDSPQAQLHIRLLGSDVGFLDLEDFIVIVKEAINPQSDKRPGRFQNLMQNIARGINLFIGKSQKMVEAKKIIPTVAGLPWHVQIDGTMVASAMLNVTNDISKFRKGDGPLESRGRLKASVAVAVSCRGAVHLGNFSKSGVQLNLSVLVNGETGGRLKLYFVPERKTTPRAQVLELGLEAPKHAINIFSIRSDLFTIHNDKYRTVLTPATQRQVQLCAPQFVQRWSGQRPCLSGFYQQTNGLSLTPFPLLSGPVYLDVRITPADRALKEYTAAFTMTRDSTGIQARKQVFKADFSALGEELKRQCHIKVEVDPLTMNVHVDGAVPEVGLQYDFELLSNQTGNDTSSHRKLSSVLSLQSRIMHSLILEVKKSEMQTSIASPQTGEPHRSMMAKFNISVPGLSFHAEYEASSGRKLDLFINKITIRYYCEPTLGIFYSLHWRPQSAPRNGHLSEYKFKNEGSISQSLSSNWKALDTMSIIVPGDNLTLVNSMSANYSYAQRYTTLYWTSNVGDPDEKLDVIRMHAEVHNTTTPGMHRYHYKMHLEYEGAYDVDLDGRLEGPVTDIVIHTAIDFRAMTKPRLRRSLSSLYKRLDKVERSPATTIETPEVVASRRWAQLTNTFLDWLSEDTQQGGQNKTQAAKATLAAQGDKLQTSEKLFAVPMRIFSRPSWRIEMDARIKTRFRISKESHGKSGRKVEGFDSTVSVNITMADPRMKIWALNGTLGKGQGMDFNMSAAMSSDLVNFTLLFDAQQRRQWPFFYHFHKWQLADITAHRYDRSFSLLFDLERNDHFNYNLTLVSPRTNVSHAINFSTHSLELRTVQANMYLHSEQPQCDIRYIEASKLTPSGLVTTVDMNSTWLNLDFDMNIDFLTAGAIRGRKRFVIDGKVPFLLGPRQLDIEFSRESRSLPSLLLAYKNVENHTSNVLLQLQSRDAVLVTFSNRMAGAKKNTTSYQWRIHLAEPTVLQNSIEWDPKKSQEVLGAASYILHAGAHSLKVFGQTMALNIHKNVTDMVIPFINQTVSEVVDRITKAKMKQVAEQGLDPRQHVPLLVKVMKGGLKIVQELQMSWQNSETGQLAESLGVHSVVSYSILATSGLPSFILKGQPFFIRQYINFRIRPTLKEIASSGRFNFSIVLPFVWDSIVSMPRTRMLIRQTLWWKQLLTIGSKADLPFIAIVPANRVQMFDVFTQDIAVPAQSNCTYLLSTNFDTGNYSILLSHEGITMVTQTTGLTLATDGRLTSLDRNKELSQVPAALGDLEVTLEAGQVIVELPHQVRVTVDFSNQMYVIETSFDTHNRSLGLLGIPSRDHGDDFMMPAGRLAPDSATFLSSYELSGQQECRNITPASFYSVCPAVVQFCAQTFLKPQSALSQCFAYVDPSQFYELCLRQGCAEGPSTVNSSCSIVHSYLKLCRRRTEVDISSQLVAANCGTCAASTASLTGKVDIVLCVVLSERGVNTVDPREVLESFAELVEVSDSRLGLVQGEGGKARALLFDGELFVSAREAKDMSSVTMDAVATDPATVTAILRAADYPFRADARRLLVLVTDTQHEACCTSDSEGLARAQEKVLRSGVSVILASDDAHLADQQVTGVTWDKKSLGGGISEQEADIPQTALGRLVKESHGLWMSLDVLEKGKAERLRKLNKLFLEVVQASAPSACF